MNSSIKILFVFFTMSMLVACQGGNSLIRSGDKSEFANQQPRESYLNSPEYINVQLGAEYMRKGDYAIALSKLKKALAFNPDLAIAHSTIAVLYETIGENELAERHYKRAVSLDANDPRIRNNYGRYLCGHGNEREGIEQFKLAADNPLYSTPQLPLTNAGTCAMRINELDEAEVFFRRALEIQPTMAPALLNMMRINLKNENYLQARAYLQRYKDVADHTAETLWAGYQIEKQLGDKDAAANFAVRLKSRYPDSVQTSLLLKEISNR